MLGILLSLLVPELLQGQVDTLSREQLRRTGRTALSEIIAALVPGFNVPQPSNTGASDALRSATLHGMGADQFVVLLNGRRRLESALLNLSESIGRGQGSTDLDAIPLSAIERIEVHRAGDAARYGFGAVAGVINIVLPERAPPALDALAGTRTSGDGQTVLTGGRHYFRLPKGGYLLLGAELRSQAATNRALADQRQQYFNGDSRNSDPALSNRVDQRFGQPESNEIKGILSGEEPIGGLTAYAVATWSRRSAESADLWRRASDDRTVRALYPNGFLPLYAPKLQDGSVLGGARGILLGFGWDARVGYARNSVRYDLEHTENASLGRLSPTRFDAGTLRADPALAPPVVHFGHVGRARARLHYSADSVGKMDQAGHVIRRGVVVGKLALSCRLAHHPLGFGVAVVPTHVVDQVREEMHHPAYGMTVDRMDTA